MTPTELRELEMSMAYERAAGVIECHCVPLEISGEFAHLDWFDLSTSEIDLGEEAEYLESRGLLLRYKGHPNWVSVCDESEPQGTAPALPDAEAIEFALKALQHPIDVLFCACKLLADKTAAEQPTFASAEVALLRRQRCNGSQGAEA